MSYGTRSWVVSCLANESRRSAENLRPSWSWVSVNCSVDFELSLVNGQINGFFEIREYQAKFLEKDEGNSEESARFGVVESAKLVVRGLLSELRWTPGDTYEMKRRDRDKECDLDVLGDFYEDVQERFAEPDMNYIPVYFPKITTGDTSVGLILHQTSDSTFTRLVVYHFYGPTSGT